MSEQRRRGVGKQPLENMESFLVFNTDHIRTFATFQFVDVGARCVAESVPPAAQRSLVPLGL